MVGWKRTGLILVAVMALILSMTVVTGCGSSDEKTGEADVTAATETDETPPVTTTPTEAPDDGNGEDESELYIELYSQFLSSLTARLGISPEDLEEAVTQTEIDMVSEAVDIGIITRQQADKIQEMAIDRGSSLSSALEDAVASGVVTQEEADLVLTMIEDQVIQMVEVIALLAGNGDEDATAEILAEAVEAGLITQEEADAIMGQ